MLDKPERSYKRCLEEEVDRWVLDPVEQQQAWALTLCSNLQLALQAANMVASVVKISRDSAITTRTSLVHHTIPIQRANLPLQHRHSRLPISQRQKLVELQHHPSLRKRNLRSLRKRMIHTIQNQTTMTMMMTTRATPANLRIQKKSARKQSVLSAEQSRD